MTCIGVPWKWHVHKMPVFSWQLSDYQLQEGTCSVRSFVFWEESVLLQGKYVNNSITSLPVKIDYGNDYSCCQSTFGSRTCHWQWNRTINISRLINNGNASAVTILIAVLLRVNWSVKQMHSDLFTELNADSRGRPSPYRFSSLGMQFCILQWQICTETGTGNIVALQEGLQQFRCNAVWNTWSDLAVNLFWMLH